MSDLRTLLSLLLSAHRTVLLDYLPEVLQAGSNHGLKPYVIV